MAMNSSGGVDQFADFPITNGGRDGIGVPGIDPFWESRQLPNVGYRHPPSRKQPVRFPSHSGYSASAQLQSSERSSTFIQPRSRGN
jgi:hypothetical protein